MQLANDAGGLAMHSDNAAAQLVLRTQPERKEASTATQSGKLKGVIESRMSRVRTKSIVSEPFVTDFSSK
jgi:hypothetical protein